MARSNRRLSNFGIDLETENDSNNVNGKNEETNDSIKGNKKTDTNQDSKKLNSKNEQNKDSKSSVSANDTLIENSKLEARNDSEKLNSRAAVSPESNSVHHNDSMKENSLKEQFDVSEKLNSKNEMDQVTENINNKSVRMNRVPVENDFLSAFEEMERNRKPTVEETHTRDTFLIRNDLLERFNRIAGKQKKGFKMKMINYLLEKELDRIEKKQKTGGE